jgi:FlaG/FlaF family flagellin (archaellin)
MDNQFKTSFIPKKPIETSVNLNSARPASRRVGQTIFSVIGTFVFIGTLAALAGTFAWQYKLKAQIKGQEASLAKAKDEFDERFVQESFRLNTRIEQGDKILHSHVSPSALYEQLEKYTLQTVSFSRFSFKDNQDGTITVSGSGDAAQYETIVLQSDAFGKSGYLRNVIFTDLRPSADNGPIGFSFEATLDPSLILYRNSFTEKTNEQP